MPKPKKEQSKIKTGKKEIREGTKKGKTIKEQTKEENKKEGKEVIEKEKREESKENLNLSTIRHSAAHILAQAVKEFFPEAKLGIGPSIEQGFYYDFGNIKLTTDDLTKIENRMKEIINQDLKFEKIELAKEKALTLFKDEPYKIELINELAQSEQKITCYKQGNFIDLCKGPHITSTKEIGAVKLLKIAGAYWKGDEKNPQLQRIYGTAFPSEKELQDYIRLMEEAEKRNHMKLGKELGLFLFSNEVGPGLPIFTPKGTIIREELIKFLKEEQLKAAYLPVISPHIAKVDLYKKSGHYPYYKDTMFEPLKCEGAEYVLKPMNCPHHVQIYSMQLRSYKELPLRYAEFGTVYRYEKSGEISGLTRVRMITQDDAHIFCMPEQVKDEILSVLNLTLIVFKAIRFKDYKVRFGTRDETAKYIGTDELWNKAEKDIECALKEAKINFIKEKGEAAFYGPKIDFIVKDVLGREWQLGTVQVDYNLPEKFDLTYEGEDGKRHRPVMIHRAPFGSLERFMGIIIEHFAGKFPAWLAPVQVKLLTLTDRNKDFANSLAKLMKDLNIRVETDLRPESLSRKVRDAQIEKVPYIITIGDKECETGSLAIRTLDGKLKFGVKAENFVNELVSEIKNRA
ncbi:threonine--tRNA ligase [archaeon]|nr:threonine--tRNA ligase [archaeon]